MYHHVKKLMYTVRVDDADPRFGNMLLEQFGGANGELAAAMQYSIQGLNCDDPERKDLLMDIGTEELSHLEIVGALARLHLKPMKFDRESAQADPLGPALHAAHPAERRRRRAELRRVEEPFLPHDVCRRMTLRAIGRRAARQFHRRTVPLADVALACHEASRTLPHGLQHLWCLRVSSMIGKDVG